MQQNGAYGSDFDRKSVETGTTTWSEFPNGGKAIVEQILVSQERNPKEQDCESPYQGSGYES